jgi:CHAD domain-containing protein
MALHEAKGFRHLPGTGVLAATRGVDQEEACRTPGIVMLAGARAEHSPEAFHEWRKQAKHLRYTLETLEPVWPPIIRTLADEARTLTNYLGDDHDLTVLRQHIGAEEQLSVLIEKRRTELRDKARPSKSCNLRWNGGRMRL